MVPVNADDKLPATFSTEYVMNFADGKTALPLPVIAARLSQIVGIPVRIQQDVFSSPEVTSGSAPLSPQAGGSAVSAVKPSTLNAANMNLQASLGANFNGLG